MPVYDYKVRDIYVNRVPGVHWTEGLSREEAYGLILTAPRFINSGILSESVMFNGEGREIARAE